MQEIKRECPCCGTITVVELTDEQYDRFMNKEGNIQDILPDVSVDDRETLISGLCPNCIRNIFDRR